MRKAVGESIGFNIIWGDVLPSTLYTDNS